MELTPHVKHLFSDLLNITSKIVVKRPDIANGENNDNNITTLELYGAYRDIVEGNESITSYGTVPMSVLETLICWTEVPNHGQFAKPRPGSGSMVVDDVTQYYSYEAPKPAQQYEKGSLWTQKVGRERYTKLYSTSGSGKRATYDLIIGSDTYTNEIPQGRFYTILDGKEVEVIPYFEEFFYEKLTGSSYATEYGDKDSYGHTITYVTNENYIYDASSNQYIIGNSDPEGGPVYIRAYSYGFRYASEMSEPVDENNPIYILKSEYMENSTEWKIIGDPFIQLPDGTMFDTGYIKEDEQDLYDPESPIYYQVVHSTYIPTGDCYFETDEEAYFANVNSSSSTSTISSLYYFVESETGNYGFDGVGYYIIDSDEHTGYRYNKIVAPVDVDRYNFTEGHYVLADGGEYTYICDDCIYYLAQKVVDTSNIKGPRIITQLDKEYWETAKVAMHDYVIANYCPPVNETDFRIPIYVGETNPYYRMLNGMPATNKMGSAPKISRLSFNEAYEGDNPDPYVYELTDSEVEIIEQNGMLDKIKSNYKGKDFQYLNYLGRNRIDVLKAREARAFDILRIADTESSESIRIFNKSYEKARTYVLHRYYNPEIFQEFDHYVSYIGFLIMANAICICLAQSDDILVYDNYMDEQTINNKLISFGFGGKFVDLPPMYRKAIAENIEMLIKYRGTDEIYDIIYNICNVTDYNIFNYDIIKVGKDEDGSVHSVIRKSLLDETVPDQEITVEELTNNDSLWKADNISDLEFNRSATKYIDVETYLDLAEITLNNSYLLNYLLDITKSRTIMVDIPNLGIYKLYDLLIALFTIQTIKFGYTGVIPSDPALAATVYKFNINQAASGDQEALTILETYKSQLCGQSRANIEKLIEYLNDKPSVYFPNKDDTTLRSFSDGYFRTIQKDSPNTNLNENSFYQEVLRLQSESKDLTEYKCYTELLGCIATSSLTAENFALMHPVWEPVFSGTYIGSLTNYNKDNYSAMTWGYGANLGIDEAYNDQLIDTSDYVADTITGEELGDNIIKYTGSGVPENADDAETPNEKSFYLRIAESQTSGTYNVTLYQKCYTALTYSMYLREQAPELYNKIYSITTNSTYVVDIYDSIFSINASFIRVYKENGILVVDLGDNTNYTLHDTDTDGDIDIIVLKDGTEITYEQYYQLLRVNADNVYKMIIAKIESMINSDNVRDNLVLSHESAINVSNYIASLINVFKAYNVEIRDNKVKYSIKDNNPIRTFDRMSYHFVGSKREEIGLYDTLEFRNQGGN